MSKRCICEICTCGRHKCPHRPTNHLGQGQGPCQLTEYTNVYKPHAIPKRESFKPEQRPMQGGEFEDRTTQRQDFRAHPIERPYVHQHDQYVKPQGEMDTNTSYKTTFTEKHGAPARAIRHDGQRNLPAKFEGEPTYRSDYRKWDAHGRPQAYGQQAAWQPPQGRVEDMTTFRHDYRENEIQPRHSFKPTEGAKMSDTPFEDKTSHRDAYIKHQIPAKFQREREQYRPSGAPIEKMTTFKQDYRGAPGELTHSFKPEGRAFQSEAPFDDGTTNRADFKKWPIERPYQHAHEAYHKPMGEMEMNTTHNTTYREMPLQRVLAMRPNSAKKSSAPFDGTTNYSDDFRKWQGQRAQPSKQPDYVPNQAPFEGQSTYGGHYVPHAVAPPRAIRPDNQTFQSDARFEDGTMYRQDYVPKPIQICEAAVIDQATSRFRFSELDARGHKLYAPVQTSITPLQPQSPMQSQQRLAMSMA